MATRTDNASRPAARRARRVLLATAITSLLVAAPASALPLTVNTPILTTPPVAGQATTCTPVILGLPLGSSIQISTGLWGSKVFSTSTSSLPIPKLITLAKSSGGQFLFCSVTVTPPSPLSPVSAAAISRIKGIAPANTSLPSISGTAKVGNTVTCQHGNWTAVPSSFSFRWFRNGTPTSTGRHRRLTSADRGQSVKCSVVAHNPFGSSAPVSSSAVTVH